MQAQTMRATIVIRSALYKRLKLFSQEQGKPMSEIVEIGVRQVIDADDENRLNYLYKGLFALAGTGKKGITDASSTINEMLYGEDGAWKGSDA